MGKNPILNNDTFQVSLTILIGIDKNWDKKGNKDILVSQ